MAFWGRLILLLLLCAASAFAAFAFTGKPHYKRYGMRILIGTLLAAFVFFAILILERIA